MSYQIMQTFFLIQKNVSSDGDDIPNLSDSAGSEGELFRNFTPSDIVELEMEYQKTKNKIAHNKKFLNGPAGAKLPDNGAKLKSFIESEEKTLENLQKALQNAKENVKPDQNGQVVITDEQKLQVLQNKIKMLNQK